MIYFTSDLHLCHDKEFVYKSRGFNSIAEMNNAIVENWNNVVKPQDEVLVEWIAMQFDKIAKAVQEAGDYNDKKI